MTPSPATPTPDPPLGSGGLIRSARAGQVALALILLWFLVWDLRAVLTDQRHKLGDSTTEDLLIMEVIVRRQGLEGLAGALLEPRKGPGAALLSVPFAVLVDDPLLATRLPGVLLSGLMLVLLYRMTTRLSGRREAGLLAALLFGSFPGLYGWFRMDNHDSLVAVAVVLTLQLMLGDLLRARHALLLGLCAGVGFLLKVSYPVFVLLPGAWYLMSQTRRLGGAALRRAGLALAAALLVAGWFPLVRARMMLDYISLSHDDHVNLLGRFTEYLTVIPGSWLFLAAAVAGAVVAWVTGAARREALILLGLGVLGSFVLITLAFVSWPRYIVPIYALCPPLIALGVAGLARRAGRRWTERRAWIVALAASSLLLLRHGHDNLSADPLPRTMREFSAGMVAPDRRPYVAMPRAWIHATSSNSGPVVLPPSWLDLCDDGSLSYLEFWRWRGLKVSGQSTEGDELEYMKKELAAGRWVPMVLCHMDLDLAQELRQADRHRGPTDPSMRALVAEHRMQVLGSYEDPNGRIYSAVRVLP